jgi:hypothetical protein
MPYKFNESRRHKIPKAKYRVQNWPEYDAALARRGSLTVWFTEEAVAAWHAPATGERGGQPVYSAIAIEASLALRLVFHQPLRQTEGLLRSIADVLGINIAIPDHTTLSRRGGGLTILPKRIARAEPLHLLVDSTGLKIYGEGEWLDQKHGIRSRRRWRKLHLGIDADTHAIVAVELTPDDVGDVSEIPDLLDQIDGEAVYDAVAARHPSATVIIPPRATSVAGETITTQRDRHLAMIGEHGRMGWQRRSGYNRRSLQDHHRPETSGPSFVQSEDRGKNRVQCAQPDDGARHAGLRPGQLIRKRRQETPSATDPCTNAAGYHIPRRPPLIWSIKAAIGTPSWFIAGVSSLKLRGDASCDCPNRATSPMILRPRPTSLWRYGFVITASPK